MSFPRERTPAITPAPACCQAVLLREDSAHAKRTEATIQGAEDV